MLFLLIATLATALAGRAQTFTDTFNYTDGALVGQGGWVQIGSTSTNPITVASGSISLASSGQDVGVPLGVSLSSGTFYTGFDINLSAAGTGDYFFAFNTAATATNYTARFFAKSSGSGYVLGIQMGVSGATPTYSSTPLNFGTKYRVVIRYDFVSGTLNDTALFYISPTDTTETNNTAAVSSVAWAGTTTENTLAALTIRQGTAGSAPTLTSFDNLIVSTSFATAANLSSAPSVSSTAPSNAATAVSISSPISVTFSQPVTTTGSWFTVTSMANGALSATASGGPTTFTLTPSANLPYGDTVTVQVLAAQVTDQATGTVHPASDYSFSFATEPAPVGPTVTASPTDQTVIQGANVQFSVTATGTAPLTYQWREGGNNLSDGGIYSGTTTSTLTLTGVAISDGGSYDCVVTNSVSSATSNAATLTVNPPPASPLVTTQPISQTANQADTVSFTVAASGTTPFTYQWRKNGLALTDGGVISGSTTATLTLTGITTADAGGYDVVVSNGIKPSATSAVATLTVVNADGSLAWGGGAYTQNFDGLPNSGTYTLTSAGPLAFSAAPISATGLAGWSLAKYSGTGTVALFRVDNGAGNSGSVYSYGTTSATDRALGTLSSGSTVPRFGVTLVNTTGQTITQFTLSYTGEQWRRGSGAANKLTFEYAVGGTDINTGTFTGASALNFVAPVTTGSSVALDGNALANRTAVSGTVDGISWAPGQTLILRWSDTDDTGSDDGLAIDDLSFDTFVRPAISSVSPLPNSVGIDKATPITVTFNEPVDVSGSWFTITGASSGAHTATVTGGPTAYTITPDVAFGEEAVTVSIASAQVIDQATGTFHLASDYTYSFSTVPVTYLPIHTVQGSGPTSTYAGQTIGVQGVVVATFQGSGKIGGYYVEAADADQDSDPSTSEGIYVFDNANTVAVGDVVKVVGTVTEYGTAPNTETEISPVLGFAKLSSGSTLPTPVEVSLPFASTGYAERYEGMLVTLSQTLTVTDNYDLGQYGELLLSNGRLSTPTNIVAPGAAAQAQEAANLLNQLILDDGMSATYPDPTPFLNGSDPTTATRRTGSTTTGLTGVLDNKFGAYVIEPTAAPTFVDANPRGNSPASTGSLRVAIGNVENFMNGDGNGGGFPTSRGATTYAEFQRQLPKVASAIVNIAPDIMGLTEIENDKVTNGSTDSYGPTSAIAQLVAAINALAPAGTTYAFVNASAVDIVTDQIHCAFIYRTETVEEAGTVAMLNDPSFNNQARNPLAQTFRQKSTGEKLTVCINHFRAKGSAASGSGNTDSGDGQGTNNALRVQEADALTSWLATSPTGDTDPDILIIGDLNSYAKEDPIVHLENAGYISQTERYEGAGGYSYSFNGEFGHLDHALASPHLSAQVKSAATWHVNSDEPVYYDYNVENKSTAEQAINVGTPYRYSDHDPVILGVDLAADAVAPAITTSPATQSATVGDTVTFKVVASGTAPLSYVWRKDGTSLKDGGIFSGTLTDTLTLTGVTLDSAGSYDVVVSNSAGDATSDAAALRVNAAVVAPTITTQPMAQTVTAGGNATFTVAASGTGPFNYVWRKGGTPLQDSGTVSGSTTDTLALTNVATTDAGSYDVVVSNSAGNAMSNAATLTVKQDQTITFTAPADTTTATKTVVLSASASSGLAVTFTLESGPATLSGSTLTLTGEAGTVSVRASQAGNDSYNAAPDVERSFKVTLATSAPTITLQPANLTVSAGSTATLAVAATGNPTPTYQWRKNFTPLAGATSSTLVLDNVQTTNAGSYDVIVSNDLGSVKSQVARLTVTAGDQAPVITSQPVSQTVLRGHTASFSVVATGVPAPTYQWLKNGATIDGATDATLTLEQVQSTDAATYSVVVTNRAGHVTSAGAALRVIAKSYAGSYFGKIGEIGFFAIYIHDDNTGVFLAYLTDSGTPFVTRNVTVDDDGNFQFEASSAIVVSGATGTTTANRLHALEVVGTPPPTTVAIPFTFSGTIDANGQLSGTVSSGGSTTATLSASLSSDTGTGAVAGFYEAPASGSSDISYTVISPDGQVLLLTLSGTSADAGVGTVNASGVINVTTANNATVTATVTSDSGTLTAQVTPIGGQPMSFSGVSEAGAANQRFVNLSVRGNAGTGENVLISGLVVNGTESKPILIRAVGPGLAAMHVSGTLAKPRLQLLSGSTVIASNTRWGTAANVDEITAAAAQAGAFPLTAGSDDSAIYITLAPGIYTIIASGADGGSGNVLLESYDLSTSAAAQKLVNISGRLSVGTGDNVGIAGFVISGSVPKRVLIRGVGPTLASQNVAHPLSHPRIQLFSGNTVIAQNTGWPTAPNAAAITSTATQVGAFPLTSNDDSALLLSLAPGIYTVILSDANSATGVGLVEVYEVP